ncbi:type VII secretion protein EccE [Allosaccharopolyspora coralli]|uniref:Type VII secretion protein EccE n=1 Tax=Allosaccharopolyspora coralli TaxID=2665642 RepID=A0A5Q3QAA8_9PSEU|nr:type VII secretion protein EccE [Allosaccharopolyspora coralli]
MAVNTQHPAQQQEAPGQPGAARPARIRARRRTIGASLGFMPVANIIVIEIGLAIGLILVLVNTALWPVAAGVAGLALVIALLRRKGRWFTQWCGLVLEYAMRDHIRVSEPPVTQFDDDETGDRQDDTKLIGGENHRVALLRLAVPGLVVASRDDHNHNPVGMAWNNGTWSAVLMVEPTPSLINEIGSDTNLPLSALSGCLEDRGVVLDSIQVLWHCYPGSAALPANSPALNAYLDLLGPRPAAARRTTWIVVRLDPQRCAKAVQERGGGVVGAHRALIGALSRVRNAMERSGVSTRPLAPDELLQAGITSAELNDSLRTPRPVGLQERWSGVTAGGVGHTSFAITGWPSQMGKPLNEITGVRALSTTIAMEISPSGEPDEVGLRGLVRVSARVPSELSAAETQLQSVSKKVGITLTPLRGLQISGFSSTIPLGGAA